MFTTAAPCTPSLPASSVRSLATLSTLTLLPSLHSAPIQPSPCNIQDIPTPPPSRSAVGIHPLLRARARLRASWGTSGTRPRYILACSSNERQARRLAFLHRRGRNDEPNRHEVACRAI